MADKPDVSQFAQAGEAAGKAYAEYVKAFADAAIDAGGINLPVKFESYNMAFQSYYQHALDLAVDQYGCPRPSPAPQAPEDEAEGGICKNCWCDTCARVDVCDAFSRSSGLTPPPCAACPQDATAPLMPRSAPAECGTYEDMPKDCKACWCKECGGFEDCVVEKDGFDPNSDICPCDGCHKGQRYMPKENPPCEHYTKRA